MEYLSILQSHGILKDAKSYILTNDEKRELVNYFQNSNVKNSNVKNIVIFGAGPVGLMTAILIKQSQPNLNVTIFEKRFENIREQILVIDKNFYDIIPKVVKNRIWGKNRKGCYVHAPNKDLLSRCYIKKDTLPLASVSINILQDELARFAMNYKIKTIKPNKNQKITYLSVDSKNIEYKFDNQSKLLIPYDFLIGADGSNSYIRESVLKANYAISESNYKGYAGAFILHFKEGSGPKTYSGKILPETPKNATIQNRVRWFLTQYNTAYIGLSLTEEEYKSINSNLSENIKKIIDIYIDFFGYNPDDLNMISMNIFEIYLQKSDKNINLINDKIVCIVGDASFNVNFFSGSGLNLGIRSAQSLVKNFNEWTLKHINTDQFITSYENAIAEYSKIATTKSIDASLNVSKIENNCKKYSLQKLQKLSKSKKIDPKQLSKEELCFLFLNE